MRPKARRKNRFKDPLSYLLVMLHINDDPKYCPIYKFRSASVGVDTMFYLQKKHKCDVSIGLMVNGTMVERHTWNYEDD